NRRNWNYHHAFADYWKEVALKSDLASLHLLCHIPLVGFYNFQNLLQFSTSSGLYGSDTR
ncbi:hypothetical protein Tco_0853348, partial [Tanacetum coccineum]